MEQRACQAGPGDCRYPRCICPNITPHPNAVENNLLEVLALEAQIATLQTGQPGGYVRSRGCDWVRDADLLRFALLIIDECEQSGPASTRERLGHL